MAAAIASLRAVMSVLLASGIGPVLQAVNYTTGLVPATVAPERSSALLQALDRHGPQCLEPDPAARDVSNLGGHGERADLVAHDVDPADLAEGQCRRGGDRQPQPVAARGLEAAEGGPRRRPEGGRPREGEAGVGGAARGVTPPSQ